MSKLIGIVRSCSLLLILISGPASAGPLLILSEVFYDTPGILNSESDEEWIEIFNASLSAIDISGYTIEDNSGAYTIAAGTTIGSGQTLVFARDTDGFFDLYGFNPDFGDLNLSLANGGDRLDLKDSGGTLLDMVAWEDFVPAWSIEATEGKSIKRSLMPTAPGSWLSNQTPNPGDPDGLVVVPEPATLVMLTGGLLAMLSIRWLGTIGWMRRSNKSRALMSPKGSEM